MQEAPAKEAASSSGRQIARKLSAPRQLVRKLSTPRRPKTDGGGGGGSGSGGSSGGGGSGSSSADGNAGKEGDPLTGLSDLKRVLDHESSELYRASQGISPATADEVKINEVLDELLQTESNYLRDIQVTTHKFAKPLRELLAPQQVHKIFSNLATLKELHDNLASQLPSPDDGPPRPASGVGLAAAAAAAAVPSPTDREAERRRSLAHQGTYTSLSVEAKGHQVANAFIRMQPYFKSYATYCANYPYVSQALPQAVAESPRVASFLKSAEAAHGVTLSQMLFRPVQRMCIYPLLWQQALKHAPSSHPLHAKFEEAFLVTQQAVTQVNESPPMETPPWSPPHGDLPMETPMETPTEPPPWRPPHGAPPWSPPHGAPLTPSHGAPAWRRR